MSICILTEDSRTKSGKAYKALATKVLRTGTVILKSLPRGDLLSPIKVKAYLTPLAKSRKLSRCVVCVDSHSDAATARAESRKAEQTLAKSLGYPVKYVIVVHALESWLLEDPQATRKVLGHGASDGKLRRTGSSCQPDRGLSQVYGHFDKSIHDVRIAEEADVRAIAARNASFQQFVNAIRDP